MSDNAAEIEQESLTPKQEKAVDGLFTRFPTPRKGEKPDNASLRRARQALEIRAETDVALTRLSKGHAALDETIRSIANTRQQQAMELEETRHELSKKKEEITIDKLTGLKNKAWFEEELVRKMQEAQKMGVDSNLWLVYIDLDKFKFVNSAFGHPVGDQVLQVLGKIASPQDHLARIGGEEFGLLIDLNKVASEDPDATDEAKLRAQLSKYSYAYRQGTEEILSELKPGSHIDGDTNIEDIPRHVTLSFGVTRYHNQEEPKGFMARASSAVLKAKNSGRDRAYVSIPNGEELIYAELKMPK